MTQFYTRIIDISIIHNTLDELEIEEHKRKELIMIAESGVHHVVIDTILSDLSEEGKKKFLELLGEEDHEKIWDHLRQTTENIEEKIRHTTHEFLHTLRQDVEKLRS